MASAAVWAPTPCASHSATRFIVCVRCNRSSSTTRTRAPFSEDASHSPESGLVPGSLRAGSLRGLSPVLIGDRYAWLSSLRGVLQDRPVAPDPFCLVERRVGFRDE